METSEENASDHYDNNLDPTLFLEANQFLPEIKHENESADEYIVPSTTDPNFSNVNINEPFEQKPNIGFGFKCELCGHSMPTKNALYKHRFRKHNLKGFTQSSMPESCHLCLKVLSSRDSLKQHMEAKHTNNTYVCDHCGHSLPTKNALSQHRIRKHRDIEKEQKKPKFKCTTCSQNFDTPENLNSHKATEHAKRVFVTPDSEVYFECEECGHKLPTRNSLSQHRLRKHRPKKEGKHTFTCVYCDMVLPSVQRLQKHLLDSHDAIPGLKQMVDNM